MRAFASEGQKPKKYVKRKNGPCLYFISFPFFFFFFFFFLKLALSMLCACFILNPVGDIGSRIYLFLRN